MPGRILLLGAVPLTIFTGAMIGTAVATEPVQATHDPLANVPQHEVESLSRDEARKLIAPRDQYALETPDGTVEVAELAYHGRLRDRMREQPFYGAESEAEAYAVAEYVPEEAPTEPAPATEMAAEQRLPDNFVPLEPGVFENTQPSAQPAERVAQNTTPAEGKARVIHIAQELTTQP